MKLVQAMMKNKRFYIYMYLIVHLLRWNLGHVQKAFQSYEERVLSFPEKKKN